MALLHATRVSSMETSVEQLYPSHISLDIMRKLKLFSNTSTLRLIVYGDEIERYTCIVRHVPEPSVPVCCCFARALRRNTNNELVIGIKHRRNFRHYIGMNTTVDWNPAEICHDTPEWKTEKRVLPDPMSIYSKNKRRHETDEKIPVACVWRDNRNIFLDMYGYLPFDHPPRYLEYNEANNPDKWCDERSIQKPIFHVCLLIV